MEGVSSYTQPLPRDVLAIGVGSAGCRIVSQFAGSCRSINRFAYVTTDESDLRTMSGGDTVFVAHDPQRGPSPSSVRGAAARQKDEITQLLRGAYVVFVVAGLGGSVGSGLAPYIASLTRELGIRNVGIAVMPYKFERTKHFFAGVALRRMRRICDAVIIVDNDELLEGMPDTPLLEAYAHVNAKIAFALDRILSANEGGVGVGLSKLIQTVNGRGHAVLSIGSGGSESRAEAVVFGAVRAVYRIATPSEASRAILFLAGDGTLSTAELATSASRLNSLLGGGSIEVHYGVSKEAVGHAGLTAVLLASGFRSTKFDRYDPLGLVLQGREIDDDLDSEANLDFAKLPRLD